jgi:hypothetical protein
VFLKAVSDIYKSIEVTSSVSQEQAAAKKEIAEFRRN